MHDQAIWLYGVTRDITAQRLTGVVGVAGGPVRLIRAAGLAAVVGAVPLAEYDQEPLTRNLADLTWLDGVARAHHEVVDLVARIGPVVPTRLATIYRQESGVEAVLAKRRADLCTVLDRVQGRTEWGVKAYALSGVPPAVPGGGADPAVPDGGADPAVPDGGADGDDRPGLAYLRRRRAQLSSAELAARAAVRSAEQVHELLARHAEVVRRHTPHNGQHTGAMLLNGAYLAPSAGAGTRSGFVEVVRELAGKHPTLRLELTGPWPPYSFAGLDVTGEGTVRTGPGLR